MSRRSIARSANADAAELAQGRPPPLEGRSARRTCAAGGESQLYVAGYDDDEILRALLESRLSSVRTLRLLGNHGDVLMRHAPEEPIELVVRE